MEQQIMFSSQSSDSMNLKWFMCFGMTRHLFPDVYEIYKILFLQGL